MQVVFRIVSKSGQMAGVSALDWNPQGNRKRGRPVQTWRRSRLAELKAKGLTWTDVKKVKKVKKIYTEQN